MTLSLAREIAALRLKAGLTQIALSKRAGLSSNYVCRLEAGEFTSPSYDKVEKIKRALTDVDEGTVQ
jgi:predicted transcriptional regulator